MRALAAVSDYSIAPTRQPNRSRPGRFRRDWLSGHLVLARRIDDPRFQRIYMGSPRNVVHVFRLTGPAEVDEEFTGWLAEAYQVGAQQHLPPRTL